MIEKKFMTHKGFMSTSLSKKTALDFAFTYYSVDCSKIPVLLEIILAHGRDFYGINEESI